MHPLVRANKSATDILTSQQRDVAISRLLRSTAVSEVGKTGRTERATSRAWVGEREGGKVADEEQCVVGWIRRRFE